MVRDTSNDEFSNIFQNAILPVDPRKLKVLVGTAQYVAVEVLVSQLIRRFMKAPQRWTETIMVHTLSLPFMGGAVGFADNNNDIEKNPTEWSELFTDGAKGIPAVLLAQWVIRTFSVGFNMPWFNMKDLLITAGAKTITRPLTAIIIPYLPEDMQDNYELIHAVINKQAETSNLRADDKAAPASASSPAQASGTR